MNLALSIALIAAVSGILILAIGELMNTYNNMATLSQDILDETVYYFKSQPAISCKLLAIHKQGYSKPNVTLEVTYPDGSIGELITPLAEFQDLWERED